MQACRLISPVATALYVSVFLIIGAGPVFAHAVLKEIVPADGAQLDSPPAEAELIFNEGVTLISAKLFDAGGRERPLLVRKSSASLQVIKLPEDLSPGDYLFSYRVTSGDGHPVAGAVQFRIVGGGLLANLSALRDRVESDALLWPSLMLRTFAYAALIFAAGGAMCLTLVRLPAPVASAVSAQLAFAAAVGVGLNVLLLGVKGAQLSGEGFAGLFDPYAWQVAFNTANGTTALLATLGLGGVAVLLLRPAEASGVGSLRGILVIVSAVAASLSFAVSGHVTTAEPRWLVTIVLAIHALAGTFWLGGLYPLLATVRNAPPEETKVTLDRFSGWAIMTVSGLLAAGIILAWVQLEELAGFFTAYGARLGLKILLVGGLLVIAVLNRNRLVPMLAANAERARVLLAQVLRADLLIALGVIAATASLNLDPPPRNINMHAGVDRDTKFVKRSAGGAHVSAGHAHHSSAPAVDLALDTEGYRLNAAIRATSETESEALLTLVGKNGMVLKPIEGEMRLSNPEKGIQPLSWKASPTSEGVLKVPSLKLPFAGVWRAEFQILVDDFTQVVFKDDVDIRATDHEMVIDMAGMSMNTNVGILPRDCREISQDVSYTVRAGRKYAEPGMMFGFDRTQFSAPACARVTVTFVNDDEVRHQFMVHGLPKYLYPLGMFHLEANGGTSRTGTFIVPSSSKTYLVHCDMAHHMEKGLKGQFKVAGGNGDLPSIKGVSAGREEPGTPPLGPMDWLVSVLAGLAALVLVWWALALASRKEHPV